MIKRKIAIFTNSRSEVGILSPLIQKINKSKNFDLSLIVSGSHLLKNRGNTVHEINKLKVKIKKKIHINIKNDTAHEILVFSSKFQIEISKILQKEDFDLIIIAGDRFDMLPIVLSSIIYKKPILHLHGGEKTEGLIDEQIRHMITKSAHIHCVVCEQYKKNVISMGEEKWRVHNTGALWLGNLKKIKKLKKNLIFKKLNLNPKIPVALFTYHPVTLEFNLSQKKQLDNIFKSFLGLNIQLLITMPGLEVNNNYITDRIRKEVFMNPNFKFCKSVGYEMLYNLYPHLSCIIGNSSSGIIEAPFFKIPTINIRDRQKGRFMHKSILQTTYSSASIIKSIKYSNSKKFRNSISGMKYEFGSVNSVDKIIEVIKKIKIDQKLLRKKLVNNN